MRCTQPILSVVAAIALCAGGAARAQRLDDSTLHEVRIRSTRKVSADEKLTDFSPGQKVKHIDSVTMQQYRLQSIANLLTQQVPVYVKSYGFNGLATLNFRGSSSAQSAVYWNGIPIQNAALGVADVSTLPVLFMNKVNLVYGGSSALWGSGNVGGALVLETDHPVFDSGRRRAFAVSGGLGSFGQYMAGLSGSISGMRWYAAVNSFGQSARNNFSYTDVQGSSRTIAHSRLQSGAVTLTAAYKIADSNTLSLGAWLQQYDREIPETLTDLVSVKQQRDASLRTLAAWSWYHRGAHTYARASYIRDLIDYSDPSVLVHTNYTVNQYFHEVGHSRAIGLHGRLLLFSPVQLAWLQVAPGNTKDQLRAALAAVYSHKLFADRLILAANVRQEFINDVAVFLPGANASFLLSGWLSLRVNAQRSYRAPTLNELYYFPGGNRNLRPEQGWSQDAGYTAKVRLGSFRVSHDLSAFNRNIKDWIIWLGNAIWTPYNIAQVHSRGIETENSLTYSRQKWQAHLNISTAYVLATTVESYAFNDGSIGKQIPYTPRYNGRANLGCTIGNLYLNYCHTYTGYRFYTTDESGYLLPYNTGNLQGMYTLHFRTHTLQLTAQCNNIWNRRYQVVANRPMPGINWQAGFRWSLP